jgi:hypothetical protein
MELKIKDEFGIVSERARQRQVYGKKSERHHAVSHAVSYILSAAGQARIKREVDARVKAEVEAIIARRRQDRIAEIENIPPPSGPILGEVLDVVAEVTGSTVQGLLGPRHARPVAWPRHLAMYILVKTREDLSFPAIGHCFGGRDHTTVMHARANVEKRREAEPFKGWLADPRIVALLDMAPDKETRSARVRKLSPEVARTIRQSGLSSREVAKQYGISIKHANEVRMGRIWADAA